MRAFAFSPSAPEPNFAVPRRSRTWAEQGGGDASENLSRAMSSGVENHVVLITGAGGGLGGTMARGLLASGRRVVGLDVAQGADRLAALERDAAATGAGERLFTIVGDVRSIEDCVRVVDAAVERFGTVDAVVNCAGLGPYRTPDTRFYDIPARYWLELLDTNVNGPYLMARTVAPRLVAQGWGRIVNVTTSYSTMMRKGVSPYGPAKAALEAATASWAADLAGTGVTANVLIPGGAADTGMVPHDVYPDRSKLIAPKVMVAPIVWLTSRAADGFTGWRVIGNDWDPAQSVEANLARAAAPAAWPGLAGLPLP